MKKAPKKNAIILIAILLMIVISLIHTWYRFYKLLYNLFGWKDDAVEITYDGAYNMPSNGIYYSEEENKCIVIYSLEQPMIAPNERDYSIIKDEYISINYCKIIDLNSTIEVDDYRLMGSVNPSPHYYLCTTDYVIYKTDDGISLAFTREDGSIASEIEYKLLKEVK